MNPELEQQAEHLWGRAEKAYKFHSNFGIFPFQEGARLVDDFQKLGEEIQHVEPVSQDDVFSNELKRKLVGESVMLEHSLSGHYYSFEDVMSLYGIDEADTGELRGWLIDNREEALKTMDKVYEKTEVSDYRYPVPVDIPTFRRQAEEYAGIHVANYHKSLSKLFQARTSVGNYLTGITPFPSTVDRSYFNPGTKMLALGMPAICYITTDGTLHINERQLIRLFGHEGMGHGLNKVVTEESNLPPFLKRSSESNRATVESVGQFYEEVIFEDLATSFETQNDLNIKHKFPEIYEEEQDTQLINLFQRRLFHYGITVLADKELGDMSNPSARQETIQRKIDLLSGVTLYPGQAVGFIENNQNSFDSRGNLSFGLASELVYAAQPVQRVLSEMEAKGVKYDIEGRSKIDTILLSGFWTPIGLVENAKVTTV